MTNKIFASKYKLQHPDPEVLKAEIERAEIDDYLDDAGFVE